MPNVRVAVVIPAYRVSRHIADVVAGIGDECDRIYVVDDACPEGSGRSAEELADERVRVLRHKENQGVGAATLTGLRAALADGAEIIVKVDGDGQMDPAMIPRLVAPIRRGEADYVKGNRFYELEHVRSMPLARVAGNALLSFLAKFSTGYWELFDPTNGFTAIHAAVARSLPLQKLSRRFFFESDMLFRLNTLRAVVREVPMPARYGEEDSNLVIHRVAPVFLLKHVQNTCKRILYSYFLRGFSIASIELVAGAALGVFGLAVGASQWLLSARTGVPATSGTVMLAALPVLIGLQLLLAFLGHDSHAGPTVPIHRALASGERQD